MHVWHGRRGTSWHSDMCDYVSKIVWCDSRKNFETFFNCGKHCRGRCNTWWAYDFSCRFTFRDRGNGWNAVELFFSLSALARLRKVRCRAGFWVNLGWSCKGVGSTLHTLHHSSHSTLWTSPPTPAHTPHPTIYKFMMIQKQRKVIEDCFNKLFFKVLYVICVRVRTTQDMETWHIWYQNNWLRLVRSWFRSQPHITLAAVHQSLLWVNQLPNGRSMGIKCLWYFCQQEWNCYLHRHKINQKLTLPGSQHLPEMKLVLSCGGCVTSVLAPWR